jgi:hypothetical protein
VTGDVRYLKPLGRPVQPVDEDVVALLELLLGKAKEGAFNGIAFTTVQIDGAGSVVTVGTGWRGQGVTEAVHTALGGVAYLQHRLSTELIQR